MGTYKIVKTAAALKRYCLRYFASITAEEPIERLVQTGISNKGKPIYERVPVTRRDANGEEKPVMIKRYLKPPTLEALCNSIPISMDTWERYAKLPGYNDVCAWAKAICKESLIERGLDGSANARMAQFVLENGYGMKKEMTVHGTGTVEDYLNTLNAEQEM